MTSDTQRWTGPLEIYPPPWWWGPPRQRARGPAYRLTPQQIKQLIRNVEYWIRRNERRFSEWILQEADSLDLIEAARQGRSIAVFDGDMPQPDSEDSYNNLARRSPTLCGQGFSEVRSAAQTNRYARQVAAQQAAWEAERQARQRAKEAEADRLWNEDTAERIRREWHVISDRFIGQPFVRVRIGPDNIQVRDEDSSWTRKFMADTIYYVPDEVADALVNRRSSRLPDKAEVEHGRQ